MNPDELLKEIAGAKRALALAQDHILHLELALDDVEDEQRVESYPRRPRCPRCGGVIEEWANRAHGKVVPLFVCRRCKQHYDLVPQRGRVDRGIREDV
ncbi:MAG: hypothetical protein ACXQT3_02905 [Methermicoccaceae archaeon]